jgi:pectate lyase-like protein
MTVQSTTSRAAYIGTGVITPLPIPFRFLADGDIRAVMQVENLAIPPVTWVLGVDYTLTGARAINGGTLTPTAAIPVNATVVIDRGNMQETQLIDYKANDPFPEESAEDGLDRLTMLLQQKGGDSDRSPTLYPTDTDGAGRYNANNNRIVNLADGVGGNDAVNYAQVSALIGPGAAPFFQSGAGAVARTYQDKAREVVTPKDFGAAGNGVSDDSIAFAAALASTSGQIYVPPGSYVVSAIPELGRFWGPGLILVGGVRQYLHPIPGPVNEIYASSYGADPTGVADSYAALQRAIDFAQENDLPLVLEARASYRLNTGLTFKHGRNSTTDTRRYFVKLEGNYATLLPTGSVRAISIVPRCTLSDINTGRGEASIRVSRLVIEGALAPGTAKAMAVGFPAFVTSAYEVMRFEDIVVNGFTTTGVVTFMEVKHAFFSGWVQRSGSFEMRCQTTGGFCGDFFFESCEWGGGTVAVPPLLASCSAGEVRGIKLVGGSIYGSGSKFDASGTGAVGDIWLSSGVQFDGPAAPVSEAALTIFAQNTARIFQIHITDVYFVAYQGPSVYAQSNPSATIYQLAVNGGAIGPCVNNASNGNSQIYLVGVESASVRGVEFDSITAGSAAGIINVVDSTNILIQGNKSTRSGGNIEYGVLIGGAGTNNFIISDNAFNCTVGAVNDYSAAATKLVTDNIRLT